MVEEKIVVVGQAEVNAAIRAVAGFNVEAAATRAIQAVIPFISEKTRRLTGTMASMWQARDAAFYNPVEYSPMQEFGTAYIEPTHAIQAAWDAHSPEIVAAYSEEIDNAISQAGFTP